MVCSSEPAQEEWLHIQGREGLHKGIHGLHKGYKDQDRKERTVNRRLRVQEHTGYD